MSSDCRSCMLTGFVGGVLLVIFVIIPAIGYFAHARAQVSVSVFGISRHSEPGYCQVNPGIGGNYQLTDDLRIGTGWFQNSKCRWTNATGFVYDPIKAGDFRFGVAGLRLTGYRGQPIYTPLPVGSYRFLERDLIDFFAVKVDHLAVAGAAWRHEF